MTGRWTLRRAAPALAAAVMLAVPASAAGLPAGPGRAARGAARAALDIPSAPRPVLSAFRVDVSRYPLVGLVLTVPGGGQAGGGPAALGAADFSVSAGGRRLTPAVRQLSPQNVELAVAPDGGLPAAALAAERSATEAFLASLPAGEQAVAVAPGAPAVLSRTLSGDPAAALLTVAGVTRTERSSAAVRLSTALSAFTAGERARRTVVLAVTGAQPPSRGQAALFARRLAASGTALYVLDAVPGGAPAYDALAARSGGFAARVAGASGWAAAFARIDASLAGQYYLRVTDPRPLPGRILVAVRTSAGVLSGTVDLPAHNPVAPPLPPPSRSPAALPPAGPAWDTALVVLATALIIVGISYGMSMVAASRRDPRRRGRGPARRALAPAPPGAGTGGDLFFVFLMPCLNEEAVIANSVRRLLSLPGGNFAVLVIDDGSDDRTAEVVAGLADRRVLLMSRQAPLARQGKGAALNAGFRYLIDSQFLDDMDPDRVIAVVVDADGRLDPDALSRVAPAFSDPAVGAVQIGVRINNRFRSTLARMQDMEFVIYTEVFQRGRRHLGSVGLGGNGQFMRLTAMMSLGTAPWGGGLAEDLDMGIRMIAAGWRNEYCSAVAVHQQGVEQLARLIRQRSRWFQGHLQSWQKIPLVLRRVRGPAQADLLYHITSPAVLLIASLLSASFLVSVANAVAEAARGEDPASWWLASCYALTFGPSLVFSAVYWAKVRAEGLSAVRAVALAHLYVCYGMMWYAAGWWGTGRTVCGRTSWAKTDRVEEPLAAVPVRAPGTPALARGREERGPELVSRGFTAGRPGQKMVGDITCVPAWQGRAYLATVTDCATRKIVGWAMDVNCWSPLIRKAVRMAARNAGLPDGATFHGDRGSDYTPAEFARGLKGLGIRRPVGRTGTCYDIALAESVNGTLKAGLAHRAGYPTRQKAYRDIARWTELRGNRTRLHPGPGYRTPQEVTDERLNGQAAARANRTLRVRKTRGGPRRTRARALAAGAALLLAAGAAVAADWELRAAAPPAGWITAFNGYGSTAVTGAGGALAVSVAPGRATTPATSHAALVVTSRSYGDFALTLRLRTGQQLRAGAAGRPNPWEVAWVLWHYTSNKRFYALTLEPTGWELSKQDPAYPGGERFLASGLTPRFPPGTGYTVGVVQVGGHITVSADGRELARYTDASGPYRTGAVGLYTEDARATFDHIAVGQLSTGGQ